MATLRLQALETNLNYLNIFNIKKNYWKPSRIGLREHCLWTQTFYRWRLDPTLRKSERERERGHTLFLLGALLAPSTITWIVVSYNSLNFVFSGHVRNHKFKKRLFENANLHRRHWSPLKEDVKTGNCCRSRKAYNGVPFRAVVITPIELWKISICRAGSRNHKSLQLCSLWKWEKRVVGSSRMSTALSYSQPRFYCANLKSTIS